MAGIVYVAEYDRMLVDTNGNVVMSPLDPPLAEQTINLGAMSARSSQFTPRTKFVQISIDSGSPCSLAFGGSSVAFATVIAEPRSGPNQGLARPPFTALRVVATSNVGSPENDEASKRVAVAPKPAHPPSASMLPTDASPRRSARRDTKASCCSKRRTIT